MAMIAAVLLAISLGAGSLAQAAPLAQQPIIDNVNYAMWLSPQDAKLCVGQTVVFPVSVRLIVTEHIGNQTPYDYRVYYSNEEIKATVLNENVGTIEPTRLRTSVSLHSGYDPDSDLAPLLNPRIERRGTHEPLIVSFAFTAKEKGVTTIRFEHTRSAKPLTHALTLTAQVEVVDCWEAYSSALGQEWPTKDICSLERPFLLEAKDPNAPAGITGNTQVLFFWPSSSEVLFGPNSRGPYEHGRYVYVEEFTASVGGLSTTCQVVSGGNYEVQLYDTPKEGDILMLGDATQYCPGSIITTPNVGTRVAFRALGEGNVCQESLPGLNP